MPRVGLGVPAVHERRMPPRVARVVSCTSTDCASCGTAGSRSVRRDVPTWVVVSGGASGAVAGAVSGIQPTTRTAPLGEPRELLTCNVASVPTLTRASPSPPAVRKGVTAVPAPCAPRGRARTVPERWALETATSSTTAPTPASGRLGTEPSPTSDQAVPMIASARTVCGRGSITTSPPVRSTSTPVARRGASPASRSADAPDADPAPLAWARDRATRSATAAAAARRADHVPLGLMAGW